MKVKSLLLSSALQLEIVMRDYSGYLTLIDVLDNLQKGESDVQKIYFVTFIGYYFNWLQR